MLGAGTERGNLERLLVSEAEQEREPRDSMANALEPEVRVNSVLPGVIDTAMIREDVLTVGVECAERYRDRIPLERFVKPSDVADVAVFLAGDAAITAAARGWWSTVG